MINFSRTELPLETRAKQLVAALRDYRNAESSLSIIERGDDTTGVQGTIEEVGFALDFYCYESKELYSSFTAQEIESLKENGVLTPEVLIQLAELPDRDPPLEQTESKESDHKKNVPHFPSMG